MNYMFDLKYAWRLLVKSWGYSLLCAGVVALSVGLTLWTYSLIYSQSLKPMGFPGSERWYSVQIAPDADTSPEPSVDAYTYQEIRKRNPDVDYIGAFSQRTTLLSEGQASASLRGVAISPRLLAATGGKPLHGRLLEEADAQPGAAPVVVLSYDTWKNYFASDAAVVGKQARIDGRQVQIVGVLPETFFAFRDFEVWQPLQPTNLVRPGDSNETLVPMVQLKEGQSLEGIAKGMGEAVRAVNGDYPALFKSSRRLELIPGLRMFTHTRVQFVATIGFLALAILLLGCVNISLVFFARFLERSRELALRTALGASRGRLMRQSLLETGLVVILGLLGGCALAALGVGWARDLSDTTGKILATGRISEVMAVRPVDLAIAALAAIAVWLLSTLLPAWRVNRQDPALTLAGTGKGASVRGSAKSTSLLVGVQVMISCLVLVICGNLGLGVSQEANKATGVRVERTMASTYPTVFDDDYAQPDQRLRYWDELKTSVENRIPGARVAFVTALPTMGKQVPVSFEAQGSASNRAEQKVPNAAVSDDYFDMLGIRAVAGRLFDNTDNLDSLKVAVIDKKTAERFWPGQNPIGKRIQLDPKNDGAQLTIVGIASEVAGEPYSPDVGVIYQPLRQVVPQAFHLMAELPKGAGDSRVALRAAAYDVDRELPLHNLQMLQSYIDAVNTTYKAMLPVLSAITVITAMLAATGLFGLISRSVTQRTQEIGIRRALGATQGKSVSMFVRQGAIYLVVGIVGIALGIVVSTLIGSVFPNILDNVAIVAVGALLLMGMVIFAASYFPIRRALALEPGDALRYE